MNLKISQIIENNILSWFFAHGVKIILIAAVTYILIRFGKIFLEKIIRRAVMSHRFSSKEIEKKREDTLINVFYSVFRVIIWAVSFMTILSEVGVNIGPLIAGAGVVGLAFGFGGQYLIKDIISGLFIILENQFRVGDVVSVGDITGVVEGISIRMTTLRDLDGTVHHVPNGEIKITSNLTKFYSRVNLNVGISYSSDLEKVIEIVNKVGEDLTQDPEWKDQIISAPKFLRVDDFADSAVIIKILGETKPIKQWDVTGELRKRLKIAFDKEGIEIPFPQRVIREVKEESRINS